MGLKKVIKGPDSLKSDRLIIAMATSVANSCTLNSWRKSFRWRLWLFFFFTQMMHLCSTVVGYKPPFSSLSSFPVEE